MSILERQVQLSVACRPVRFLLLRLLDRGNWRNDISAVHAPHLSVKCIYIGEGVVVHHALIWVFGTIREAWQAHSVITVAWVPDT